MRFWRWVGLLLIVAVTTVYFMARRLPQQHSAVAHGIVSASQDKVWHLIIDEASQLQWRTGLMKIMPVRHSTQGECWIEVWRTAAVTFCRVEGSPERRLVLRLVDKKSYGGTWTYTLQPAGPDATEVTIVEDGWIKRPPVRFLGHYLIGDETNVRQYLQDLQAEATHKR